jgi:hypothetical protein
MWHVAGMGIKRNVYVVFLGGNAEGKRQHERARRRWENTIGVDLRDII